MTRRGSEWSLITRVGELVTAELINTPRRDTVNPTRITDRDAPHTSNDPWPITRARNLIFKNVHTVLHMHACTHVRRSGLKNSGHSSPLIYHFLRFPPMAASLLWWQAVANAITLLEREREGGGRGEREKEETFNNIITKEKKKRNFLWHLLKKKSGCKFATRYYFVFLLSDDCRSLPYLELWIEWSGEKRKRVGGFRLNK